MSNKKVFVLVCYLKIHFLFGSIQPRFISDFKENICRASLVFVAISGFSALFMAFSVVTVQFSIFGLFGNVIVICQVYLWHEKQNLQPPASCQGLLPFWHFNNSLAVQVGYHQTTTLLSRLTLTYSFSCPLHKLYD